MAGEKNNGEVMATLLRMLAELRTEGKRRDRMIARMARRLESLECWRRDCGATRRSVAGSHPSTSRLLNDAAQTLSKIEIRRRGIEGRRP